jgi:hypothetical protein
MGAAQRVPRASRKLVLTPQTENHPLAPSQSPATPTKTPGTYIPEPQAQRILQRYASGSSIRSIARAEHRDRATVTKVVRSDQMQEYVKNMRERFVGLGCAAMDALEHGLIVEKDSRLAYQLLRDIGVIPSGEQRMLPANREPNDQDARVRETMVKLAAVAIERNRVFQTPLPDVDAVAQETEEELSRREDNEA